MTFRGTLGRLDRWTRLHYSPQRRSMLRLSRRFVDDVLGRYGRRLGAWRGVLVHVLLGGIGSAARVERRVRATSPRLPHAARPAAAPEARTIHRLITLQRWIRMPSSVGSSHLAPSPRSAHADAHPEARLPTGGSAPVARAVPLEAAHHRAMPAKGDRTMGPATAPRSIDRLVSSVEVEFSSPLVLGSAGISRLAGPGTSFGTGAGTRAQARAAMNEGPRTRSAPTVMLTPFPSRHESRHEPLATSRRLFPASVPQASAGPPVAHGQRILGHRAQWSTETGAGDVVRPVHDGAPEIERPRPAQGMGTRLVVPPLPRAVEARRQAQGSPSDVERAPRANERRREEPDRVPLAHASRPAPISLPQTATLALPPTRSHRVPDAAGIGARASARLRSEPATHVHPDVASAAPRTRGPDTRSPAVLATATATMRSLTGQSLRPSPAILSPLHSHALAPFARPVSASAIRVAGGAALAFPAEVTPAEVTVRDGTGLAAWNAAARWRPEAAHGHVALLSGGPTSPPAGVIDGVASDRVAGRGSLGSPKPTPALSLAPAGLPMGGERARASTPGVGFAGVPEAPPATAPSLTFAPPPGGLRSEPESFEKQPRSPARAVVASPEEAVDPPRQPVPGPGEMRRIADAVYSLIVDRVRRERVSRGW